MAYCIFKSPSVLFLDKKITSQKPELYTIGNLHFLRKILLREYDFGKSEAYGLLYSILDMRYCPDLSEQTDLTECNKIFGDDSVGYTAYEIAMERSALGSSSLMPPATLT